MDAVTILIVEDDPFEAEALQLDLVQAGFRVAGIVDNGNDLIRMVNRNPIDLLIVDIVLSGAMDGIQAVEEVRAFSNVPVIFLTSHDTDEFLSRAEQTDPAAYLFKPYRKRELSFIIRMTQARYKRETELRKGREDAEKALWHLATHDPLTFLPNRTLLLDRIEHLISQSQRSNREFAVLFTDIDNFKLINDSFGHSVGDSVLKKLAQRILQAVRKDDTVARLGGDEFVIVTELYNMNSQNSVTLVSEKIKNSLSRTIQLENDSLHLTMSCGIAIYPRDGMDASTLMRNADTAMYRAKKTKGHSVQFYASDLTEHAYNHLTLESALSKAIERDELELHYQPQFNLKSGRVMGVEALLRWNRPDKGMIMPLQFIPHAEETGLITPITKWVFRTAFSQMKKWLDQEVAIDYVAVNMSSVIPIDSHMQEILADALQFSGCPSDRVEIEITESHIMDAQRTINWLQNLKKLNIRIAIDDFGTGFSSLNYLKQLPVDKLKIDRSFVKEIPSEKDSIAIIRAILTLGQNLGITTIAEGIETRQQWEFLIDEGCEQGQGSIFSKPLPAWDITRYLADLKIN